MNSGIRCLEILGLMELPDGILVGGWAFHGPLVVGDSFNAAAVMRIRKDKDHHYCEDVTRVLAFNSRIKHISYYRHTVKELHVDHSGNVLIETDLPYIQLDMAFQRLTSNEHIGECFYLVNDEGYDALRTNLNKPLGVFPENLK